MDCIFCKISKGEVSSEVVFEDDDVKVFKDIHPKAPVHLLVIPKIHIQSIAHLEADHSDVITKLIYTAKKIAGDLGLKGYKLIFNVGREGGQVVDHLHLHILGGWSNIEDPDKFRV
ncbi:MAG: histidine triad nucleotide-binding protein [Candidatus Sungiibacteriota bacterium]|uniref:Histidine triad nucleotide-binding protein n=1 Tax=Candidatus Sungiibacteriota bacterium TaxID=2750080 RepID=A0A7T5RIZ5_9BACT|nr:MAG: histidine triad nucleotide-binding protein [Candidatus Sungbacteria bacterium]